MNRTLTVSTAALLAIMALTPLARAEVAGTGAAGASTTGRSPFTDPSSNEPASVKGEDSEMQRAHSPGNCRDTSAAQGSLNNNRRNPATAPSRHSDNLPDNHGKSGTC